MSNKKSEFQMERERVERVKALYLYKKGHSSRKVSALLKKQDQPKSYVGTPISRERV
jgi:transposase-like protein